MSNDPKELIFLYFEKILLALAVILLVIYLIMEFATPSPAKAKATEVEQYLEAIKKYEKESAQKRKEAPKLSFLRSVKEKFESVPEGVSLRPWIFHKRPFVSKYPKIGPEIPDPIHQAPSGFTSIPERGKIKLSWTENSENRMIKIERLVLLRKDKEKGEWRETAVLPANATDYVDTEVKANAKYWYKLRSIADVDREDRNVRKGNKKLPDKEKVKDTIEYGPFLTPPDYYVRVMNVTVPDPIKEPGKPKWAYLKAYKWDTDKEEWISRTYRVMVGQEVGRLERTIGGKSFDMRSNYILEDVRKYEREVERGGIKLKQEVHEIILKHKLTKEELPPLNQLDIPDEIKKIEKKK
jgi:hypothetical protein